MNIHFDDVGIETDYMAFNVAPSLRYSSSKPQF